MTFNDLTGKQFPNLLVLYRADDIMKDGKKRRVKWHCRCNCGNELDVISDNLTRRPNMSCQECANKKRANSNRIDVIGNKYGRLTVLEIVSGTSPTKVRCMCECGNEHICCQSDVISGHTKSCGCLQHEVTSETNTKDWTGHASAYGIEFICQDHMNEKGQWLWKCRCGLCNGLFIALPAKVNNGHITSCGCRIQSAGEEYVQSVLAKEQIDFISQYTFDDCKCIYVLRFDFAIMRSGKLIGLIEYDGKQHFEPIDFFGGEDGFRRTQERDEIKNTYCKDHDIPLLRIPYTLTPNEIKIKIYEYYLSLTTAGCAW
jgi:hypothetical protein